MTNCICCGSEKRERLAKNRFFEGAGIVRCADCKLVYPYPRPDAERVDEFYRDSYYSYSSLIGWATRFLKLYYSGLRARSQFKWITDNINLPRGAKVLEIGCGYGRLLELFHEHGCEIHGIEPSEDCARYTAEKFGPGVFHGTLEQYDPGNNKFDLVVCSHVFEHFIAPEEVIERLKRMLGSGGRLFFELPNQESKHYIETNYLLIPDFYFFSKKNLDSFLRAHGLELVQAGQIEFRRLLPRYDMLGHVVNYAWWAVLDVFRIGCFKPGPEDSIWLRALAARL
ncbi:MAG: class I SAM-dependent methyltransferase [Gemmatimonadota bacterium]|nr:class I SAM-dependent methyltransferase [Gemmatimonadota bacterium]